MPQGRPAVPTGPALSRAVEGVGAGLGPGRGRISACGMEAASLPSTVRQLRCSGGRGPAHSGCGPHGFPAHPGPAPSPRRRLWASPLTPGPRPLSHSPQRCSGWRSGSAAPPGVLVSSAVPRLSGAAPTPGLQGRGSPGSGEGGTEAGTEAALTPAPRTRISGLHPSPRP